MRSHEAAVAEAITALTTRLASWQVEDAHTKAHEYVNDMLRHGWRPRAARAVETPPSNPRPADPETKARALAAARAALTNRTEETT